MTDDFDSRFAELSTATISDALDRLGRPGSTLGIAALGSGPAMIGRAFTVRYTTASHPPGTVGDYLDDVAQGAVVVLDNQGRVDCTVWGDILTAVAKHKGIAGTVIDGVNRDVKRAFDIAYPIFSRGRFMRTGKDRVEVAEVQGPVTIGGVQIRPGDLIIGDLDGVVAVPQECESEVLGIALEIAQREESILAMALAGSSIAEARSSHGYHDLQRRQP